MRGLGAARVFGGGSENGVQKYIYNVRTGFVGKQDGELTAKMCGSP